MSESIRLDNEALTKLFRDPVIVRVVSVLDIASLSILELLEYGLTRRDISWALSKGVIEFDKSTVAAKPEESPANVFALGDYYFSFLNNKVRLTEIGLHILYTIKSEQQEDKASRQPEFIQESSPNQPDLGSGPTRI